MMKLLRLKELHGSLMGFSLVLALGMLGCSAIQFIAPYDQKIDDGVTNLQKMTAEFLTKIERQGGSTPDDYTNHAKFYDDATVVLSGIHVRASAIPHNAITTQQLELLRTQFQNLEEDHQKIGIEQGGVPLLESAFNRTFRAILELEIAKKEPKA
jgi:hypothetical protein